MEGLSNVIRRAASTQTPGVEFSEVMSGYIHAGPDLLDFEIAERIGRSRCEAARFFLTVKSWDIAECKYYSPRSKALR